MRSVLVSAAVALAVTILCTPIAIRFFRAKGLGQEIRTEGPQGHEGKRGTPTMGGVVIIVATVVGYAVSHLLVINQAGRGPTASGLLALFLMVGMGLIGFLDDFVKIYLKRNLGLTVRQKILGQVLVAVAFGILALRFRNGAGLTPGSDELSLVRDLGVIAFGSVGFVVFALVVVSGFANAINLQDGLDGLCAGSSAMVFGAYLVITFYQFRNACSISAVSGCYQVRDPFDLTLVAAAALGACFGFLWWNANPAKIFMGDVGSMSLGALMAGIAIMSRTELLLVVLAATAVAEVLSDVIQIVSFKTTHRRVFKMAPFHTHFEQAGWHESTVLTRFWIASGLSVAFGLGVFYADFISH